MVAIFLSSSYVTNPYLAKKRKNDSTFSAEMFTPDIICTSFDVKGLTKTARFDSVLLGTIISAEVRPGCVNESICTNKSSYYTLSSISLGGSAHIGCRAGEGIWSVESSETYIGIFKIETAIKMEGGIPPAPSNISSDWMLCPSSSEP